MHMKCKVVGESPPDHQKGVCVQPNILQSKRPYRSNRRGRCVVFTETEQSPQRSVPADLVPTTPVKSENITHQDE